MNLVNIHYEKTNINIIIATVQTYIKLPFISKATYLLHFALLEYYSNTVKPPNSGHLKSQTCLE